MAHRAAGSSDWLGPLCGRTPAPTTPLRAYPGTLPPYAPGTASPVRSERTVPESTKFHMVPTLHVIRGTDVACCERTPHKQYIEYRNARTAAQLRTLEKVKSATYLRTPYALPSTDLRVLVRSDPDVVVPECPRSGLSPYARAMRCAVLRCAMLLPAFVHHMRYGYNSYDSQVLHTHTHTHPHTHSLSPPPLCRAPYPMAVLCYPRTMPRTDVESGTTPLSPYTPAIIGPVLS
eukprot:3628143-Rhodomonas_salina.2